MALGHIHKCFSLSLSLSILFSNHHLRALALMAFNDHRILLHIRVAGLYALQLQSEVK